MGVMVNWSSLHLFEPQTVIHVDFYDEWTWSDYEHAEVKIRRMCASRFPEPMDMIVRFRSHKTRAARFLMLANALQRIDVGVVIVVGADAAVYAFEPIVQRICPRQYRKIRSAHTLDLAHRQLAYLRDKPQWAIA